MSKWRTGTTSTGVVAYVRRCLTTDLVEYIFDLSWRDGSGALKGFRSLQIVEQLSACEGRHCTFGERTGTMPVKGHGGMEANRRWKLAQGTARCCTLRETSRSTQYRAQTQTKFGWCLDGMASKRTRRCVGCADHERRGRVPSSAANVMNDRLRCHARRCSGEQGWSRTPHKTVTSRNLG